MKLKAMWRRMRTTTFEHVVPVSMGGTNDLDNLVVACRGCNLRKGNRVSGYCVRALLPVPERF